MMNPLDPIMDWYQTAYDSLRVTRRVLQSGAKGLVTDRHVFFDLSLDESGHKVDESISELENVVVLALVAAFERTLRQYVLDVLRATLIDGDAVRGRIREEVANDVEFWHFSDRLVDVFETVPALDRGNVKQLIEFRNWVAHGHFLAKPAPVRAEPGPTYRRLTDFLRTADVIP
jgi:hypothetical protein